MSGSLVESDLAVDFGSLVDSLADSRSGFGAELDSGPGSVIDSGLVANFELAAGLDFVIVERFLSSIL